MRLHLTAAVSAFALVTGLAAEAKAPPLTVAASLRTARAVHSATLLQDGRVLVAGGCMSFSCEGATATTELYVPARRAFIRGPALLRPRVGHAAIRLRDGKVLVVGGFDDAGPTATAELYDPSLRRFVPTGRMHRPRGGFTATLLRDGRVLVAGGFDGNRSLADAEVYDPATGGFTEAGSMATARSAHAAALLGDGRVLVAGGSPARGRVSAGAEVWNPRTSRFAAVGAMSVARHKHAAVRLADGRVLVVGGSNANDGHGRYRSAELFDARTGTFSRVAAMQGVRYKLPDAVTRLATGAVLVAGGSRVVELYDPRARRFRRVGAVSADFSFATATRLRGGAVLIAGGYDDTIAPSRRAWLYSPPR